MMESDGISNAVLISLMVLMSPIVDTLHGCIAVVRWTGIHEGVMIKQMNMIMSPMAAAPIRYLLFPLLGNRTEKKMMKKLMNIRQENFMMVFVRRVGVKC